MKHLYLVSKGILKSGKKWKPVRQVKFSNFWRCFLNTNWNLNKKLFEPVLFLMLFSLFSFCLLVSSYSSFVVCFILVCFYYVNAYLFSRKDECGCGWKRGEDLEKWWRGFWRSWRMRNYNQMLYYEKKIYFQQKKIEK